MQAPLYFCWDVESTGLKVDVDMIIAIGGQLCEYKIDPVERKGRFVCIEEFHTYINTGRAIAPQAQAVHGISKNMLSDAPEFPKAMDMLKNKLLPHIGSDRKVVFMGYNTKGYDDAILFCNFVRHQLPFTVFIRDLHVVGFLDIFEIVKDLRKKNCIPDAKGANGITNMKLETCHYAFCGEPIGKAHDALHDARAVVNVLNSTCVRKHINTLLLSTYVDPVKKAMVRLQSKATVLLNQRLQQTQKQAIVVRNNVVRSNVTSSTPVSVPDEQAGVSRLYAYRTCLICMQVVPIQEANTSSAHHTCTLPPAFSSNSRTIDT